MGDNKIMCKFKQEEEHALSVLVINNVIRKKMIWEEQTKCIERIVRESLDNRRRECIRVEMREGQEWQDGRRRAKRGKSGK